LPLPDDVRPVPENVTVARRFPDPFAHRYFSHFPGSIAADLRSATSAFVPAPFPNRISPPVPCLRMTYPPDEFTGSIPGVFGNTGDIGAAGTERSNRKKWSRRPDSEILSFNSKKNPDTFNP
jgi:hypothetical protein